MASYLSSKNKKGSVLDPILSSAKFLAVGLTFIIGLFVWFSFNSVFSSAIAGTSSQSVLSPILTTLTTTYESMDYLFPLLIAGFILLSSVLAWKAGANAAYAVLSIIVWGLAMLMSAVFTNIYLTFKENFPNVITHTAFLNLIFTNLKWIVLAWLALITYLIFRKDNLEDEADRANAIYQTGFR